MAHEEATEKSTEELTARAWELAKSMRTCTFVTLDGDVPKARPMTAHVDRTANSIGFLASARSDTITQLSTQPACTTMFSDTSGNKYVTFTGRASATSDRAKIKELWTPFAKAWWTSSDDPDIRFVELNPEKAELWDGPNKLIAFGIMAAAAITNSKPAVGDHAEVKL